MTDLKRNAFVTRDALLTLGDVISRSVVQDATWSNLCARVAERPSSPEA